ncbi:hypothetical protein N7509_000007, partial [Penicillium cosmopolitanum]
SRSHSMEPRKLPGPAEDIRKEIQVLIPQLKTVEEDESGNKKYSGDTLSELNWEGRLRYWSKRTKLDLRDTAYLIPIPNEIEVNGWFLKDGWFVQVNNNPVVGAGATTLVITPR